MDDMKKSQCILNMFLSKRPLVGQDNYCYRQEWYSGVTLPSDKGKKRVNVIIYQHKAIFLCKNSVQLLWCHFELCF